MNITRLLILGLLLIPFRGWASCVAKSTGESLNGIVDLRFNCDTASRYEVEIRKGNTVVDRDHSWIGRYVNADKLEEGRYSWFFRPIPGEWLKGGDFYVRPPTRVIYANPSDNLQEKINEAGIQAPARLVLRSGTYSLGNCPAMNYCLHARGLKDVVIEGEGNVNFIISSPESAMIDLSQSRNVTLRNFSVDYDPLPYAQAKVVRTSGFNVDMKTVHGSPGLLDPHVVKAPHQRYRKWSKFIDPKLPGCARAGSKQFQDLRPKMIDTDLFRVSNILFYLNARVGDVLHQQARINSLPIVRAIKGQYLTVDKVTVYASPAGVVNMSSGNGLVVLDLQVLVKPGRFVSTNADILHAAGMTLGPWVENSVFWGGFDDFVNLRSKREDILNKHANRIELLSKDNIAIGDRIGFNHPQTGESYIRTVRAMGANMITLDGPVGNAKHAYPESTAAPLSAFRFNTFIGGLRHALLLRTHHSVVESNLFIHIPSTAIALENHAWWRGGPEGLYSSDLAIVGNLFVSNKACAISGGIRKVDRTFARNQRMMAGLRVINNRFQDTESGINLHHLVNSFVQCNQGAKIAIADSSNSPVLSGGNCSLTGNVGSTLTPPQFFRKRNK